MDNLKCEDEKTQENEDTEEQTARAYLRQKFLRFLADISSGSKCEFIMFENIQIKGNVRGFDSNFQNIAVEHLQTPFLPVETAILRSSDIISMHLSDIPVASLTN